MKVHLPNRPLIALSGTLPLPLMDTLPKELNMCDPVVVKDNPDRSNIFLRRRRRPPSSRQEDAYEYVILPEVNRLLEEKEKYPVTLLYCSYPANARAQQRLCRLFGSADIYTVLFSSIWARQSAEVFKETEKELRKTNPRIRLVLCTPTLECGFHSPSVVRVIHEKPPRNVCDFMQQFGRAGRQHQRAESILFFNNNDIAPNLPGLKQSMIDYCRTESCLRQTLMSNYGESSTAEKGCECCEICEKSCECDDCK